jgi:hypothetical protein
VKKLVVRLVLRVLLPLLVRRVRHGLRGASRRTTAPGAATRAVRSAWRLVDTPAGRTHAAQVLRWLRGAEATA